MSARSDVSSRKDDADSEARSKYAWVSFALAFVVYFVSPYVVGTFLPGAGATTVMLLALTVGSFLLGFVDGVVFRAGNGFALWCAIMQLIAGWIYYNEGAWLYAIAVACLVGIGGHLSTLFTRRRSARTPSEDAAVAEGSARTEDLEG